MTKQTKPLTAQELGAVRLAVNLALETVRRTPMRKGDETYFGRRSENLLVLELLALRRRAESLATQASAPRKRAAAR